jgi:Yip1 domain
MSQPKNQANDDAPSYGAPATHSRYEQAPPQEPARIGWAGRLIGTLFSPGETFEDVNRKPTWLAPFIISVAITLAGSAFFEWRVKPDWDKFFQTMVEKRLGQPLKELPPDQQAQINKQLEWQKKFAKTDFSSPLSILITVGKFAVYFIFAFLIPAGVFALGLMFMQAKTTFKKILSVVAWSWCATTLVYSIVVAASLMVRDRESFRDFNLADPAGILPTNLAVILPSGTSPFLSSIAGSLDIFTIWYLILLAIGFAAIAGAKNFKPGRTATLVFGIWVVWILVKAGFASIGFGRG